MDIIHPLPPSSLPKYLYRIHYPSSWTALTPLPSLLAKDRTTLHPPTLTTLTAHLTWKINLPSPFISTLSSKPHAISWARSLEQYKNPLTREAVKLITLKPRFATGVVVYNPKLCFAAHAILPPEEVRDFVRDEEYIILHSIPSSWIVSVENIDAASINPVDVDITKEEMGEGLNMPDPRVGFDEFITGMEDICLEMKLILESFKRLGTYTQAILRG
ncbi:hypothetical protein TWF481_005114 [Arthrobotrys musiformis]|uniref:DUF7587 domain-containing protein n=1 Tax=Arthrobotrys musiformis TaxID=47236 RepID=A0AAV9WCQ7_9PEZI